MRPFKTSENHILTVDIVEAGLVLLEWIAAEVSNPELTLLNPTTCEEITLTIDDLLTAAANALSQRLDIGNSPSGVSKK
jgi:hypothetical protein